MRHSRMIVPGAWFCIVASAALGAGDEREQLYKQHLKNSRRTGSYLEVRDLVLDVLKLADQSLREDDIPLATRCAHLAVETAEKTGNGLLVYHAQLKKTRIAASGKAATRIARHLKTLKASPTDPAACLEVGRFVCALKDDWATGCGLLEQCSTVPWASAGALDKSGPSDAAAQLRLARLWYDASQEAPEYSAGFVRRAIHWAREARRNGGAGNPQELNDFLAELPIVHLIDLEESAVKTGPWQLGKGTKGNGESIMVGDIPSPNGLGLHASDGGVVSVAYKLNGQFKTFHGGGAIGDHNVGDPNPVNFQVWEAGNLSGNRPRSPGSGRPNSPPSRSAASACWNCGSTPPEDLITRTVAGSNPSSGSEVDSLRRRSRGTVHPSGGRCLSGFGAPALQRVVSGCDSWDDGVD